MKRSAYDYFSVPMWITLTLLIGILAGCSDPETGSGRSTTGLLIFAAASTTDVLGRLATEYETQTGIQIQCSFAASSTLARQIEAGAPADVFISADPLWMDRLEKADMIRPDSRRDLLGNELVLIAPRGQPFAVSMQRDFSLGDAFEGRLALGDPAHVPAGIYGRQALESLGWWNALEDRLIPALDVRDALRLVALGEATAGIVYATDAADSKRVEVIAVFPPEAHDIIRYPIAVCGNGSPEANDFVDYLFGEDAGAVFESAGFTHRSAIPS